VSGARPPAAGDPFRTAAAPGVLAPDAPPAFLLDATRNHSLRREPGYVGDLFDNRSVTFPTDFPSAPFLHAAGVRDVLLVQYRTAVPAADLAHTLRRWQAAGLIMRSKDLASTSAPLPLTVAKPSWVGWVLYRALTLVGLKRHALGGFGGMLSTGSSS
jgi:hypothetical protein